MQARNPERWSLSFGADLSTRCWGDECVVHHALSNDTHRLSAWVTELLLDLAQRGPTDSAILAAEHGLLLEELAEVMQELQRLDLVCPF